MYRTIGISSGLITLFILGLSYGFSGNKLPTTNHPTTDAYDGWKLGTQAYTFNRFTLFEAIDKTASLGLDWIEAYPGQVISKESPDVKFTVDIPPEVRLDVQKKLKESGIKLINFGVINLPNDDVQCRKVFDFAKAMGVETIVSEPPEDAIDLIEKLCEEYQIKVAIHNHPKPSRYWNPDKVWEVCQGRSKWLGSCADTGHWMRSGIDPLEALKKLEGRIISLHFKDLNEFGIRKAHDVVWGTGKANVKALLSELHRQNFQGSFSVEYEHNWENSVPEIRQCAAYFNQVAGELKPSGWHDLITDDLSNCLFNDGSWTMEDGVLIWKGGGYIWTNERYGDFILDLEYMVSKDANSGIFFRTGDLKDIVQTGIELQIHETTDG
ncbi:TIM barrel protein, partial [bacterium]|nr:TIM barrel protein [bacterium]